MKLYSENNDYKLYQGNMLDMLEVIEPETIDSIVTDPPYELNFMGKGWDNAGVSFQADTWKKCYDVLKPGGYLLAFGGSRTFHRIACAIEDAGFEIRDTIMWLYGSGFPKSMDISKQIDKRGENPDGWIEFSKVYKDLIKNSQYNHNDIDKMLNIKASSCYWARQDYRGGLPPKQHWNKIKEILGIGNQFDYLYEEAEREVIGKRKVMGKDTVDIYGKYKGGEIDITLPSTDLAKQWQGWGTALKPSFEPIIVARKPFKGSLVDNVIEYGVGGINIDECRIAFNGDKWKNQKSGSTAKAFNLNEQQREAGTGILAGYECEANDNGRFPANTILTYDETDFDEVCGGFPDTKSGGNINFDNVKNDSIYGSIPNRKGFYQNRVDSGSASRYFMNCKYTGKDEEFRRYIYAPKASKKDRDEGLPDKWFDSLEIILYNNIGDELWKDKITIKEGNKAKHLEDMEVSLQKVIEEYGTQTKKDIDLNTLLHGKKSLEKYLKENKYTTKTEINSTTISQILNLLTLYTTKENTQDVKLETENGISHVEIVENINQLEIIIKENQELVPGANNVVLKMLLKINEKEGRNEHCTVKPTTLMQYLVRLVTPNGGTILDPFNGSGSTGKAVMYENKERNKNYKYIGIELTEEYLPIAKARIEYVCNLKEEKTKDRQMSIFDEVEDETI